MRSAARIIGLLALLAMAGRGVHAEESPFGVPATPAEAAPQEEQEELELPEVPQPEDPAVAALLATQPETPDEKIRAAVILAQLGETERAKEFLSEVLAADLDDDTLAQLGATLGSTQLFQMAGNPELAPQGKQLSQAIFEARNRKLRDPQRIANLIQQLQSGDSDAYWQAIDGLQEAGEAAVGPLIEVLTDTQRSEEHGRIHRALATLGDDAIKPLTALLAADDPTVQKAGIRTLVAIEAREAAVDLMGLVDDPRIESQVRTLAAQAVTALVGRETTRAQRVRQVVSKVEALLAAQARPGTADPQQIDFPVWDSGEDKLEMVRISPEEMRRRRAAWLAGAAYGAAKDDPHIRKLYAAAYLNDVAWRFGLERLLWEQAPQWSDTLSEFSTGEMSSVLVFCQERGLTGGALGAVEVLRARGDSMALHGRGDGPTPLVLALQAPDRRLRFAALRAVMAIQAGHRFPGASRVGEALTYFASTTGKQRAIVAGPIVADSMRVAGELKKQGYEVDVVTSGLEMKRTVAASPDYELMFVAAGIQAPPLHLLINPLRQDGRSARIPLGILARAYMLDRAEELAESDPYTLAFPRPHNSESVQWQVNQLLSLPDRDFHPRTERIRQAQAALDWLIALCEHPSPAYPAIEFEETVLAALSVPELQDTALVLLGYLGTARAQRAAVEMAGRTALPIQQRVGAVSAFRRSVQEYGVLLTTDEILQQYDRYNASESADPGTQKIFSLILDCIEAPTHADRVLQSRASETSAP